MWSTNHSDFHPPRSPSLCPSRPFPPARTRSKNNRNRLSLDAKDVKMSPFTNTFLSLLEQSERLQRQLARPLGHRFCRGSRALPSRPNGSIVLLQKFMMLYSVASPHHSMCTTYQSFGRSIPQGSPLLCPPPRPSTSPAPPRPAPPPGHSRPPTLSALTQDLNTIAKIEI